MAVLLINRMIIFLSLPPVSLSVTFLIINFSFIKHILIKTHTFQYWHRCMYSLLHIRAYKYTYTVFNEHVLSHIYKHENAHNEYTVFHINVFSFISSTLLMFPFIYLSLFILMITCLTIYISTYQNSILLSKSR